MELGAPKASGGSTSARRGALRALTGAVIAGLAVGPLSAVPAGAAAGRIAAAAGPTAGPGPEAPQAFSSQPERTWGTSPSEAPDEAGRDKAGRVLAIAEVGGRVFLAGEFAGLTPPGTSTAEARHDPALVTRRPYLVALDAATGALVDWDARPDGPVLSLAASADGRRLYAGGMFRTIGGRRIARLAALDVDTAAADPAFSPPAPDAYVKALAVSGGRLYVGGAFSRLGPVSRPQLAALDAATGTLIADWIPPRNSGGRFVGHTGTPTEDGNPGNIAAVQVSADGALVVIAGSFLHFGGRSGLIVLDARTARPTGWQPVLDRPRPVFGLGLWPADGRTIFAAAGGPGGAIEAFTPGGATRPVWVRKVDGDGIDAVATARLVYFVGHYDYVLGDHTTCGPRSCTGGNPGDTANHHIAAFDAATGDQDVGFTAQLNTPQGPDVAAIGARHLYVGGDFTTVNGEPHPGFAAFAATAPSAPLGRRP
jgi:hypothetical protein